MHPLSKESIIYFQAVTAALNAPAQYLGSSATRNLSDNLSDLKAQVVIDYFFFLAVTAALNAPSQYPGSSATHNISDNV